MIYGTIASNRRIISTGDFYAEFTMDSTTDKFRVNNIEDNIQYSSDNTTWIDMPTADILVTGSLKWYVRQKPSAVAVTQVNFKQSDIASVDKFVPNRLIDYNSMFLLCHKLRNIVHFDTSKAVSFSHLFEGCQSLQNIPILDASNVEDFRDMFNGCTNLHTVPLLDTSKGTNFESMFTSCTNLTTVPLLDTSNAELLTGMFLYCTKLETIPDINTSNCISFGLMFGNCIKLNKAPTLDLSKGISFKGMYSSCTSLKNLGILNTSAGTDFDDMFKSSNELLCMISIDTTHATSTSDMFNGCTNLVAPNTTDKALIIATPGISWTNPNSCTGDFYFEDFLNNLGSEWSISPWHRNTAGFIFHQGTGTATLTLPTMPSTGKLYMTYKSEGNGTRNIKNNGSVIGTFEEEHTTVTKEYTLPAGDNVIEIYQSLPGGPPPSSPVTTSVYEIKVILD